MDETPGILNLYARYTHAIDTADEAAWLATFVETGTLDFGGFVTLDGHDARRSWFVDYLDGMVNPVRHYTSNIEFTVTGDRAQGRAYLLVVERGTGSIVTTGGYRDELVRTDAGWRFASRELTIDFPPEGSA